jgi:hypothetical protein
VAIAANVHLRRTQVDRLALYDWELRAVELLTATAGEHISARSDHLGGPSKLLAVQYEGVQVAVDEALGIMGTALEGADAGLRNRDCR